MALMMASVVGSGGFIDGFDGTDRFDGSRLAPLVASLASLASMVASLEWLRLMSEPKRGEERGDGLIHKICEERADVLTHKI